tara:strand:- start:54061 stop:54723 length:663 start_codon:yes stop_codon:yes gene_type:complete
VLHSIIIDETLKREADFDGYYQKTQNILSTYMIENESKGWYFKVLDYSQKEFQAIKQTKSLRVLKKSLQNFSKKLRSTTNCCVSYFFSDKAIESAGEYVGVGGGSTLKKDIEAVMTQINPYATEYIVDELYKGYMRLLGLPESDFLSADKILSNSKETLEVISEILRSPQLAAGFKREMIAHSQDRSLMYRDRVLIMDFNKTYLDYDESRSEFRPGCGKK